MSAGRPSSFTPEIAAEICGRIAEGESLRAICRQDEMPGYRTVLDWLAADEHADFRTRYTRAREMQADLHAAETIEIADTEDDAARARNRISARQWYAEKLKPKVYGNKVTQEHTGADGSPLRLIIGA